MAENRPRTKPKEREQPTRRSSSPKQIPINFKGISSFFRSREFQFVMGILMICMAIFLFVSLLSHIFTGHDDQTETLSNGDWQESGRSIRNIFGLFGATLARVMVLDLFGWAAFFFVPVLLGVGVKISFKKDLFSLENLTWQVLFFVFWFSSFFGFFLASSPGSGAVLSEFSGGVGKTIGDFLFATTGWGGLLVLLFLMVLFIVKFYGVNTMEKFFDKISSGVPSFKINNSSGNNFEEEFGEEDEMQPNLAKNKYNKPTVEVNTFDETKEESPKPLDEIRIGTGKKSVSLTVEPVPPPETIHEIFPEDAEADAEFLGEEEEVSDDDLVKKFGLYDPKLDLGHYQYPTLDLLKEYQVNVNQVSTEELEANSNKIVKTLNDYDIGIMSIKATIGPTVTLYEIIPEAGVRISKIKNLEDDIALSLAALGIRIIAPIPGKGTIGIEVPNKNRETVPIRTLLGSEKFRTSTMELPFVLGKTISNEIFMADLAKMPHLLMAGATGQGKSVGLNVILASLLYKKHPSELKFVLVDPKKVELTLFNRIERHFLAMLPGSAEAIITDTKKVVHTLNSLCIEMDNRYTLMKEAGCRNLKEYNHKFVNRKLNPEKGHKYMAYIVLVIDELADLMMTAGKEVEQPIARLAQLARAIGIHLVVATQRPSVNVITGIIKANFPARLSFKVTSKIDSRTILDTGGAEQLVGMGDMLLSQGSDIIRLQCAFVDTPEIEALCEFIGNQQGYDTAYELPEFEGDESGQDKGDVDMNNLDPLFAEAARLMVIHQQGSTSLIQRRMKLGYNRAGRLIDQLEKAGIVGSFEGSKAREVLIKDLDFLEERLKELGVA